MILFAFKTDVGKVRKKNEDAFGHFGDEFFLVADGLGGLPAGEVAAQLAIDMAIEIYQESKNLRRAFEVANREIYRQSREKPAYFGMCTTLVGAVVEGRKVTLANVGDSRAYLLHRLQGDSRRDRRSSRRKSGVAQPRMKPLQASTQREASLSGKEISQITVDHGLGMGVVTRVLGIKPEVKVDFFTQDLKVGDLLLLCSDGLTTMLADEEILEILNDVGKTKKAIEKKAKELIEAANAAGGLDNITVCLVRVI